MREIKFRAWFTMTNKMVKHEHLSMSYDMEEGFTVAFNNEFCYVDQNVEGTLNFELMQYTGLKDKNGVEIYEGDVFPAGERTRGEVTVVCYDSKQAKYKAVPASLYRVNAGNGGWTGFGFEVNVFSEVIGNIYSKPELLEGPQ